MRLNRPLHLRHDGALGQLQHQVGRRQAAAASARSTEATNPGGRTRAPTRSPILAPRYRWFFAKQRSGGRPRAKPTRDRHDHAALLGDGNELGRAYVTSSDGPKQQGLQHVQPALQVALRVIPKAKLALRIGAPKIALQPQVTAGGGARASLKRPTSCATAPEAEKAAVPALRSSWRFRPSSGNTLSPMLGVRKTSCPWA